MNILITGGSGFIGGSLIRKLLKKENLKIFNLDKMGYASDETGIKSIIASNPELYSKKYTLIKADLSNKKEVDRAIEKSDPDMVMNLAAESHVDRSIDGPRIFIESNILGTFNLLDSIRNHWQSLEPSRKKLFKFHHISTDEVFGSLGNDGKFSEITAYDPRSPYSASKASSDHLVRAWYHTFGLPIIITNCSNNFGPWQFPEKLIPLTIIKALRFEPIPIYGDGKNIRDWLFVEDHIDALLVALEKGKIGESYCIGGFGEKTNQEVVLRICKIMDNLIKSKKPHSSLIKYVLDRPGHDRRYAIDPSKIVSSLGWKPKISFESALENTVVWYLENQSWWSKIEQKSGYKGKRLGI